MMKNAIRDFPKQFDYEPEVVNGEKLGAFDALVVGGMGGSGLVAGILRMIKPGLDVAAHHEYGLPPFIKDTKRRLFLAVSYSGNTEETVDFFEAAVKEGYSVAAVGTGGRLLEVAKEGGLPHIELPETGIQPRMSLGFMLRAVLKLVGENALFEEAGALSATLKPGELEAESRKLAETLRGKVPVIYASRKNQPLAYNWKIKFNETGKIPAFYNTFPELNHNEMTGFDVNDATKELSERMHFIFLRDNADHPHVGKRMEVTGEAYAKRGLPVTALILEGTSTMEKIFRSLLLADWTAYCIAEAYGNEPEAVPMIEEFKKKLI